MPLQWRMLWSHCTLAHVVTSACMQKLIFWFQNKLYHYLNKHSNTSLIQNINLLNFDYKRVLTEIKSKNMFKMFSTESSPRTQVFLKLLLTSASTCHTCSLITQDQKILLAHNENCHVSKKQLYCKKHHRAKYHEAFFINLSLKLQVGLYGTWA